MAMGGNTSNVHWPLATDKDTSSRITSMKDTPSEKAEVPPNHDTCSSSSVTAQCPDEDRVRVMMMGWCGRPPLSRLYTSCCTPQWSQWSPHRHSVGDGGRPRTQPRPSHTLASHSPLVSQQSSHHPIITSPSFSDL